MKKRTKLKMDFWSESPFATHKKYLQLTAGMLWTCVGLVLWSYAYRWLEALPIQTVFLFLFPGIILASCIYFFGFSRLAKNNIQRIQNLPEKSASLFRFQKWSSYPLIAIMVSLGLYLRLYSPIPKPLLGTMYIGIGGGLFSSSFHYYTYLWHHYISSGPDLSDPS